MPFVYVETNLRDGAISADFERTFAEEISRVLNKPVERINIIVRSGQRMFSRGNKELCCIVTMHSVGVFSETKNPEYTKPFLEFLSEALKLEAERITLVYHPIEFSNVGKVAS